LCPLEKSNIFPVLETYNIIEAGEIIGENVDKGRSRMVGFGYAVREAAFVLLQVTISDQNLELQTRLATPRTRSGLLLLSKLSSPEIEGSLPQ
jgi:hypothetical protein